MLTTIFVLTTAFLAWKLYLNKKDGKSLHESVELLKKEKLSFNSENAELINQIKKKEDEIQHLLELERREKTIKNDIEKLELQVKEFTVILSGQEGERDQLTYELDAIKNDLSIYSPKMNLVEYGFFEEPEYLFNTSERFQEEIKTIREKQKEMVKEGSAVDIPDSITIIDNDTQAKKALKGQMKLMLKTFNIECDDLIQKLNTKNFSNILERIERAANNIEKESVSFLCGFELDYIELKFKECELAYQYKLKKKREDEEQARIKEQMREEEKARRDFERAIAKAEREEELYQDALDRARKELELANDAEKDKLQAKLSFLEKQLAEAHEAKERTMSMAQQTKRGHVYIISNIGSFGEHVYKIGLTRRLEPMDRVKELGDASVPFSFDVHAMIFSEDAPALEARLHREFTNLRLNQVNFRKEFFKVDLDQIREKALEISSDTEIEFTMTALAEEYYESENLYNQNQIEVVR